MNVMHETVLHTPKHEASRLDGITFLVDRQGPNWLATYERGAEILARFDGKRTFGEIVNKYAFETGFEFAKAWQHVETIARDAVRQKYLTEKQVAHDPYVGREEHLRSEPLGELWIHIAVR